VLNVLVQVMNFVLDPHHFTLLGLATIILFSVLGGYSWNYPHLLEARVQLLRAYSPAPAQVS
jgi:hypothetical protein